MSLAERSKQVFSATTRSKGDSYFHRGQVDIVSSGGVELEAHVAGSDSRPYEVVLDWSDPRGGVVAACTCPHYDDGNFCKHLWATMRAADERGLTASLAGRGRLALIHQEDAEYDYDDFPYGDDYDDDDFAKTHRKPALAAASPFSRPKTKTKQAKARAWHAELARLPIEPRHAAQTVEPLRRLKDRPKRAAFVLDVAASFCAGALVINLFQQEQRNDGQWGKIKSLKAQRDDLEGFSREDRRRLALALGNYTGVPWTGGYGASTPLHDQSFQQASQVELVPAVHEILLPELCADGCLGWVLGNDQPPEEAHPLAWDDGEPWQFRIAVDDDAKGKEWTVCGELARGEQVAPLAEPVLLLSSGLVLFQDRIARLSDSGDWRWLVLLRARDRVSVPYADRKRLLAELWACGETKPARLPSNLQVEVVPSTPRGCLHVHAAPSPKKIPSYVKLDLLYADVRFDYGGRRVAMNGAGGALVDESADRVLLRDRAAEAQLLSRLAELRVGAKKPHYYFDSPGDVEFPKQRLAEVVERLTAEGWLVEAEGRAVRRAGVFRATVASGVDWFDLETEIDFGGSAASLPQLLDALKRNERFVQLDDGSQGMLPQEWLERFAPLADLAEVDGDRLRFRPSQALLLDALLADREADVQVEVDQRFSRMREKLRTFAGVKPRDEPAGFCGDLRPYQKEGLGWLAFLAEFGLGGCLADDMGLGKTVQLLAWIVARRRSARRGQPKRPTLVVAPKSVVFNWQLEAERFAPRLTVLNYTGLDRQSRADKLAAADLVLTTYGTLRKDVESLKDIRFDYVVLDEAQAIKNDKSLSAKACRLLQSEHRLALTGTPVENHLGDLWSLLEFLNPGMLGRSAALRNVARNGSADETTLAALRRGLAPFILRRTKEQVLKDLPEKTEQTVHVELLPADRKRYDELRDHYRQSLLKRVSDAGMNASRMHVLEALLRLRQVACHAGLVDKTLVDKPSAKLEALLEQAAEVVDEGHKALVFSQFTSLLAIVKKGLDERGLRYEYLDGRTRDRQQRIERFQSDAACPLFLISLKAGGAGLNLTAADYVFLLDPWWNPAVEAQAIDRAHRIGQHRRVFAYRLVARDTVEEKIIELQNKKRDLADAIIAGDKSVVSGLTLEDLRALLS